MDRSRDNLFILVPKGTMISMYKHGTAFVACEAPKTYGLKYLIYYEPPGDFVNVVTFSDRITQAAGRMIENYPTSKMMGGYEEDWEKVASISYNNELGWIINEILDEDALYDWAPEAHYEGGSPSQHDEALMRRYQRQAPVSRGNQE